MDSITQVLLALIAIIASFGSVLVWLIKRQDVQNERLTDRFLTYMEGTAIRNTEASTQVASAISAVTTAMGGVTATLLVVREQDRADHRDIIEEIGKAQIRSREAA